MSKEYKVRSLAEEANIEDVAEYIGIEMRQMGKRISILCPCHADQHYGSCYLGRFKFRDSIKDGFRCYSCGAKGDAINLVKAYCNVSSKEAMGIVADVSGGRQRYKYSSSEIAAIENEEKQMIKVLGDDKLRLIGLAVPSEHNGLCVSSCAYSTDEFYGLQQSGELTLGVKEYAEGHPTGEDWTTVIMRCVDRNPLRTLANEDYDAYSAMVCDKCHESIEKFQDMISYAQKKADGGILGYYCRKVSEETDITLFIKVCKKKIREIEDILIDFGEKPKRENMFIKLR